MCFVFLAGDAPLALWSILSDGQEVMKKGPDKPKLGCLVLGVLRLLIFIVKAQVLLYC